MLNWINFEQKWSWPYRSNTPASIWAEWGKLQDKSVWHLVAKTRNEPATDPNKD